MGRARHPCKHPFTRLHFNTDARELVQSVPREEDPVAKGEYAGSVEYAK